MREMTGFFPDKPAFLSPSLNAVRNANPPSLEIRSTHKTLLYRFNLFARSLSTSYVKSK